MSVTQQLYRLARARQRPVKTTIELLAPCNLRCPHCYVTHNKKTQLTLPVLDKLFGQLADAGVLYLTLTGGEVALRKDLFDIIASAKRRHFSITLLSTGTLWQEAHWDRLAALGVDAVRMSVYGVTASVHDAVTLVPGSFEKTMRTARGLIERGLDVAFSCPVLALNAHEVPAVIAMGEAMGVSVSMDTHITWTDGSDPSTASTAATLEQLVGLFDHPDIKSHLPDDACKPIDNDDSPCQVGNISCFIQSTGDVLPCVNWPVSAGNITRESFLDIWKDGDAFAAARAVSNRKLTGCSSCGDRGGCHPCAGMNLREKGSIGEPSEAVCRSTAAKSYVATGSSRQPKYASLLPVLKAS